MTDIGSLVLDEIALEGLDGITLSALWIRLRNRMEAEDDRTVTMDVSEETYEFFWEICRESSSLLAFVLPSPRPELIIYNRFDNVDENTDLPCEPTETFEDIYPVKAIDDKTTGMRGSCSEYERREDVTSEIRNLSYAEASDRWGERLVLVASQELRNTALLGPNWNPNNELHMNTYVILERIARGRFLGETTIGKMGLQAVNIPSKSSHYFRKPLIRHKLITKQGFYHKSAAGRVSFGLLLHLTRFYVEYIPTIITDCMYVIKMLRDAPNNLMSVSDIRQNLDSARPMKKILKNDSLKKLLSTNERVPYRVLYPDADRKDFTVRGGKGNDPDKMVICIRLLDPNTTEQDLMKDPDEEIREKDEDDDDDDDGFPGLLDMSRILQRPTMSLARHCLEVVREAGSSGISQKDLARRLGVSKLNSRTLLRHLTKIKAVDFVTEQRKRQKITMYVAAEYSNKGAPQEFTIKPDNFIMKRFEAHHRRKVGKAKPNLPEPMEVSESVVPSSKEIKIMDVSVITGENGKISVIDNCLPVTKPSTSVTLAATQHSSPGTSSAGQEPVQIFLLPEGHASVADNQRETTSVEFLEVSGEPRERTEVASPVPGPSEDGDTFLSPPDTSVIVTEEVYEPIEQFRRRFTKQKLADVMSSFSELKMQRLELIRHTIEEQEVIEGAHKLKKVIIDHERAAGLDHGEADKKSILFILATLEAMQAAKMYYFCVRYEKKERHLDLICKSGITSDHPLVQSILQQAKLKVTLITKENLAKARRMNKKSKVPGDIQSSMLDRSMGLDTIPDLAEILKASRDKKLVKQNGLEPKFIRMRELQSFLFYLAYNYEGQEDLDQDAVKEDLIAQGYEVDDELNKCMPKLYMDKVAPEMFVNPVPNHSPWNEGWCLVSDVILRMPLSLFVKLIHIGYEVPRLADFSGHPIKRHLPIRCLPKELVQYLLFARKYLFSIHKTLEHLCFAGLVQFGPSVMKEKDQIFVYVNRHSSIKNTLTSPPGFIRIDPDMSYEIKPYRFDTREDLQKFWLDLWTICVGTPLGSYEGVVGQVVEMQPLEKKDVLLNTLCPRKSEEAALYDSGAVPGDGLGAGGLDSAFFGHLKRNWSYLSDLPVNGGATEARTISKRVKLMDTDYKPSPNVSKPQKRKQLKSHPDEVPDLGPSTPKKPNLKAAKRSEESTPAKETEVLAPGPTTVGDDSTSQPPSDLTARRVKVGKHLVRVLHNRRMTAVRKFKVYDEKDKKSLGHMRSLRVDWTDKEDDFLVLARAASAYLYPNKRNSCVSSFVIRDVIHALLPEESKNKTSRACSRRIVYMMKKFPLVAAEANLLSEEISCTPEIVEKFPPISLDVNQVGKIKRDAVVGERFHDLVVELYRILGGRPVGMLSMLLGSSFQLPSSLAEFHRKYETFVPNTKVLLEYVFPDLVSEQDVTCFVLEQVIFSSFFNTDKMPRTRQLVDIYKEYPDIMIRQAFANVRGTGVLASKRKKISLSSEDLSSYNEYNAPFRLSVKIIHQLMGKYRDEFFFSVHKQSFKIPAILASFEGHEDPTSSSVDAPHHQNGLLVFCLATPSSFDLKLICEIPHQVMIINPDEIPKTDNIDDVLDRFRSILKNIGMSEEAAAALLQDEQRKYQDKKRDRRTKQEREKKEKLKRQEISEEEKKGEAETVQLLETPSVTFLQEVNVEESLNNRLTSVAAKRVFMYSTRRGAAEIKEQKEDEATPVSDVFVLLSCKLKVVITKKQEPGFPEASLAVENGTLVRRENCTLQATKKRRKEIHESIIQKSRFNPFHVHSDVEVVLAEMNLPDDDIHRAKEVLEFLEGKLTAGVTKKDLVSHFHYVPVKHLSDLVQKLMDKELVYRLGSNAIHYIARLYVPRWAVRTFQLTREEKDRLGSMHPHKSKQQADFDEPKRSSHRSPVKAEGLGGDGSGEAKELPKVKEEKSKFQPDYCQVFLRPWIRVDGSLNRPALTQLLFSILGFVLDKPGATVMEISKRFLPSLVNIIVYDLLDILEEMKCIVRFVVRKQKTSLFSPSSDYVIEIPHELDDEAEICVEATPDAIVTLPLFADGNLSQFQQYKCSCHPIFQ